MKSGDKIEQRWKAGAVLDDIRYPYVIVDDWYTEEEEKAVWKELDFYNTMDQKARAENTIVAKKNGVPLANSYRFYVEDYYRQNHRHVSKILSGDYKARAVEFHKIVEKCFPNVLEFFLKSITTSNTLPFKTFIYFIWGYLVWK